MNEATIAQTIMTVLVLAIFLGFLIWGIKSGQFKDVESAKYHMFDEADDEPEKDRKKTGGQQQ